MSRKSISVFQEWVSDLTLMQQTVLIAAVRGPDGLHKDHVAKLLLRWCRRCFLRSAFDGSTFRDPWADGGGSFMGPSVTQPVAALLKSNTQFSGDNQDSTTVIVTNYLKATDELPHHFQLHLMHAAEILGYKHPVACVRKWWHTVYLRMVNDMHLNPETEAQMDARLGDCESQWRDAEAGVTAQGPVS